MLEATARDRFWEKVSIKGPHECWPWQAHTTRNGYGRLGVNGCLQYAHRVSVIMEKGDIPDGMVVDHLCRNRVCVNPAHLEVVTFAENVRRGECGQATIARSKLKTHCPRGHEYSGENLYLGKTKSGGVNRICKICRGISQRKSKERKL